MTTELLINLIGGTASIMAFVMFLPQAVQTWRLRASPTQLSGVSIVGQVMILGNATLWGLYGYLTGAFWVAAPGLVNAPLAIMTIWLLLRARRQ